MKCSECGRPLSDPLSIAAGHGPTCSRYVLADGPRADQPKHVRHRIDPDDPACWRHLFDTCDRCPDTDEDPAVIQLPIAHCGNGRFVYRCGRGHRWSCWYNVAMAEQSRFCDCTCDDCREFYGSSWRPTSSAILSQRQVR